MKILYNFASRSRPERFVNTILNVIKLSESEEYSFLVKLDPDDERINDYFKEIWELEALCLINRSVELSSSKIDAINRCIPKNGFDILVNLSDDMTFTVSGFDMQIRANMERDTLLHFPDNFAGSKLITMQIMDYAYYMRDQYVYHPDYFSLWADNDAMELAKLRGRYKYVDLELINHEHYSAGLTGKDALYRRNDTYGQDREVFYKRQAENFGFTG